MTLSAVYQAIALLTRHADDLLLREAEELEKLEFPRCDHLYWLPDTETCDGCGIARCEVESNYG